MKWERAGGPGGEKEKARGGEEDRGRRRERERPVPRRSGFVASVFISHNALIR
jgi:hypothetical protein